MKKKLVAVIMLGVMAMSAVACGKTESKNSNVVNNSTVKESLSKQESIKNIENDVKGDADVGELNLKDCREWQLGTDIKNGSLMKKEQTYSDKLLFPNASYIVKEGVGYLRAKGLAIANMELTIKPKSSNPKTDSPLIANSKGVVNKREIINSVKNYSVEYYVNELCGYYEVKLFIEVKKNATEAETAQFRKFVDEFAPAFETTLLNNFQ